MQGTRTVKIKQRQSKLWEMASPWRSAAVAAARAAALRSKPTAPKPSVHRRASSLLRRSVAPALGGVQSLMPLHSAVASVRLKSFIAVNSSCWSWLSQGRAVPL